MTNHTGREAMTENGPCVNTDVEIWRLSDSYYAPSIHVTENKGIGINVGGYVFVKPIEEWHRLAKDEARRSDSEGAAPSSIEDWKAEHLPNATREAEMHRAVENGTAGELIAKRVFEAAVAAPSAPHILEALSYHQFERDDLTLDEAVEALRHGWKKIHGRTERQFLIQIASLLAAAPSAPVVQASLTDAEILEIALFTPDPGLDSGIWTYTNEDLIAFARSLLAAQTKTPHGMPSDKPINQGIRATGDGATPSLMDWIRAEGGRKPLPDYGELMPVAEFEAAVKDGSFIPYDGTGYFATTEFMDVGTNAFNERPDWATHVMWFNR